MKEMTLPPKHTQKSFVNSNLSKNVQQSTNINKSLINLFFCKENFQKTRSLVFETS